MSSLTQELEQTTERSTGLRKQRPLWFFGLIFLFISVVCSLPRFGQRENEHLPTVSDSDRYLEMARVFTGEQQHFTPEWVADHAHHYNRPLLPFAAGWLGKLALFGNVRAAFSLLNIVAAALGAFLLFAYLRAQKPDWRLAWLPSVLFLTGFPQLNWGYHILTDSVGYGTAIAAAVYGDWLVRRARLMDANGFRLAHLAGLFVCSAIAFLARETAWIAFIAVAYSCYVHGRYAASGRMKLGVILAAMLLGILPHAIYAYVFHVHGVPLKNSLEALINWRYLLDFVVKSGVCFNFSWLLAAWGAWIWVASRSPYPPLLVGWAIAATLYTGAGYFVNNMQLIGYPLRMSYAVFPIMFFWITALFESRVCLEKRLARAIQFCAFQFLVNLAGVFLDPGRIGVSAIDVLRSIRDFILR
jgi:hypothetical protein